jgi:hypothetical protein
LACFNRISFKSGLYLGGVDNLTKIIAVFAHDIPLNNYEDTEVINDMTEYQDILENTKLLDIKRHGVTKDSVFEYVEFDDIDYKDNSNNLRLIAWLKVRIFGGEISFEFSHFITARFITLKLIRGSKNSKVITINRFRIHGYNLESKHTI